ncbi:hypothetical protein AB833_30220 [Chromatiales bacterium (ex Bugula neritina AB1)]|nr:hypothetical protein AB833_30220 [Chromatiales bacterium (ex Bugula neritina AB1)]
MDDKITLALTSIYDTASNPELWSPALDHCVSVVGARCANLMFHENIDVSRWRFAAGSQQWRMLSPEHMQKNIELFKKYDQKAWDFVYKHPKQTILCDTDFPENGENVDSREDYQFLAEHMGIRRKVGCALNDNQCWVDNIAFQFDKSLPVVPNEPLEKIRFLLPHAAKAVEMWRTFSLLKERYNAVLSVLDFVDIGICIADNNGSVIVSNNEADRVLDAKDGLIIGRDGKLHCRDSDMDRAISHAIAKTSATSLGDENFAEALYSIDRAGSEHPLLLEISPLRDTDSELARKLSGAMITIIDPDNPVEFDTKRMAQAYKLTRAESAVCKLLVDGWTSKRIAEERNVQIDTIKSQIKSILSKTNTDRRSELIRLALKATPPVR